MPQASYYTIRPMQPGEAERVSALVRAVLLSVSVNDYDLQDVIPYAAGYDAAKVSEPLGVGGKVLVAEEAGSLIGCAAIAPLAGQEDTCILQTLYVRPDREFQGVGRSLVLALEATPLFASSRRAVLSSSITAHEFYLKLGYRYLGGQKVLEENDHYWMEKILA